MNGGSRHDNHGAAIEALWNELVADDWWTRPAVTLLLLAEPGDEMKQVRPEVRVMDEGLRRIEDVPWVDRALRNLRVLLGRRALVAARGLHAARARDAGTAPG